MLRRSFRSLAAWWLLAVMALTVTPRELLHQCGRSDGTHQGHSDGATLKTICSICDVALPVAIAEEVPLMSVVQEVSVPVQARTIAAPALGHEHRSADRGPPSV
jgi:hypothetical protein